MRPWRRRLFVRTLLMAALVGVALGGVGVRAESADPFLLVSSNGTDNVLRYDGATGAFLDAFVPAGSGGLLGPTGLVFGPDGNLYVSSSGTSRVLRYDGATGAFLGAFVPAFSGGLFFPLGLVFGPDGNLYVGSFGTGSVLRYDGATGAFLDVFVPFGSGGLDFPRSLVFGPDGNLYVSDSTAFTPLSGSVLRYDGATGAFLGAFVPAGSGGLEFPTGLVFGPDGNLYASSPVTFQRGSVLRYDGATGAFLDTFVTVLSGLSTPGGLVFGPDGNLYMTSAAGFARSVLRFDGATGASLDTFVPFGSGGLDLPVSLVFSPAPCNVDSDRDVDITDLRLIRAAIRQRPRPGDPRDANGNGRINVADVRFCTLRCTRASCVP